MTSAIAPVFFLIGVAALIAGMILSGHALSRYGSESAPRGLSLNPRCWRPAWRAGDWFTDARGYRLHCAGALLLSSGGLAILAGIIVGYGLL